MSASVHVPNEAGSGDARKEQYALRAACVSSFCALMLSGFHFTPSWTI